MKVQSFGHRDDHPRASDTSAGQKKKFLWRRLIIVAISLFVASLLLLVSVMASGYDDVLWHSARSMAMGESVPLLRIGSQRIHTGCGETEIVSIERPDVTLIGEIYGQSEVNESPAILLMHGSTPLGRNLGFYRVLACELSSEGYLVLAMDQRDFGDSGLTSSITVDMELEDVQAILDELAARSDVDDGGLYIVSHSMGAAAAMAAAATGNAEGINALVAIGPSRRVYERILAPDAPDFDRFYRRDTAHSRRSGELDEAMFRARLERRALETHQSYWSRSRHVPLLLVDGEKEDPADLAFLQNYFNLIEQPKGYITQPGVAHYVGTHGLTPGNSLVLYDQERMDELVEYISDWLNQYPDR